MVTLRAYHPFEGAGVLELDGKLIYIEFPYSKANEYECSPEEVDRLILRMNFEEANEEYNTNTEAVEFLRGIANQGDDPYANEDEESILETYNVYEPEEIDAIVDSIQRQSVDKKDFEGAILALERISKLRVVLKSDQLQIKVLRMLNFCRKEIEEAYQFKIRAIHTRSEEDIKSVEEKFVVLNGSTISMQDKLNASFHNLVA